MKMLHLFHHNDLDGRVSAAIAYEYFDIYRKDIDRIQFYEINYTTLLDGCLKVHDGDVYVFVDYSFSRDENIDWLLNLIKTGNEIVWIDHHKSSVNALITIRAYIKDNDAVNFEVVINENERAAALTYRWAMRKCNRYCGELPNIIKYVDSWDTWKKYMPNTDEFHYGIEAWDYTARNFFRKIFRFNSNYSLFSYNSINIDNILDKFILQRIKEGKVILEYTKALYTEQRSACGFNIVIHDLINNRSYLGYAMNGRGYSLSFGDNLNKYDFCCQFYRAKNNQWVYSLYSEKDDVLCNELAFDIGTYVDGLGGGGHKGAAGFQTKKCLFDQGNEITIKPNSNGHGTYKIIVTYTEEYNDAEPYTEE